MICRLDHPDGPLTLDLSRPHVISIPLDFDGPQPNHFGVDPARSAPLAAGGFLGDTRQGGSCNVRVLHFIPHCNGTHTESVGHIVDDPVPVSEVMTTPLHVALLVTVAPVPSDDCDEEYRPRREAGDRLVTAAALRDAAGDGPVPAALVVRTLPNDPGKRTRRYLDEPPPYFTMDAMRWMVRAGVRHLLTDLPSVDRMFDEGALNNHRIFWRVPFGERTLTSDSRRDATITEMVHVPDTVSDGRWGMQIEVPPFLLDAAPSRVRLFPLVKPPGRDVTKGIQR